MDDSSDQESVNDAVAIGEDLINDILNRVPYEVVKAKVDAGAPLWFQDSEGSSALHAAAYVEDEQLVRYLLEHGAIWNAGENVDITCSTISHSI